MSTSMMMCLRALGHDTNEDEVNKVMGATPAKGAAWENALATAQHYGCRATLTAPATIRQLKAWTDRGVPVMIAWNPEGREWSHASCVYDVTEGFPTEIPEAAVVQGEGDGLYVWVADSNLPHPEKTIRIVHEDVFYSKWYEKWPRYLVRRPAMAVEREITPGGRQVMASTRKTATSYVKDWLQQAPGSDSKDLEKLEITARKGPGVSRDLKKTLTDVAYDEGYWGNGLTGWLLILGRLIRVDMRREYKNGAEAGREDGTRRSAGRASMVERVLRRHFKTAEEHDCWKDWKLGTLTWEEYQACLERFRDMERNYRAPSYDAKANWWYLWADIAKLMGKDSNAKFLRSVGDYVKRKGYHTQRQDKVVVRIRRGYDKAMLADVAKMKALKKKLEDAAADAKRLVEEAEKARQDAIRSLGRFDASQWKLSEAGWGDGGEYHGDYSEDPYEARVAEWFPPGHEPDPVGYVHITLKKDGVVLGGYDRKKVGLADLQEGMEYTQGLIAKDMAGEPLGRAPAPKPKKRAPKPAPPAQAPSTKERHTWSKDKTDAMMGILDVLIAKGGSNAGMFKGSKGDLERGKGLTEGQLKAIRHNLYKSRMRTEADSFRLASTAPDASDVLARFLVARAKKKKKTQSEKDKLKIPKDVGKRRDPFAQGAKGRKTTPGHKRKERPHNVEKGHSRKQKHKKPPER
jgi:hypothetical protein